MQSKKDINFVLPNYQEIKNQFFNKLKPMSQTQSNVKIWNQNNKRLQKYDIGASAIQLLCSHSQCLFVASRHPDYFEHFWMSIIDLKITLVVNINNQPCDYIPAQNQEFKWSSLNIKVVERIIDKWTVTRLEFTSLNTNKIHNVTHIHWLGWIDYGCPKQSDYSLILDLCNLMQTNLNKKQSVLVHCFAGVGRTGTLYAIFDIMMLIRQRNVEKVCVLDVVSNLRKYRRFAVQNVGQYNFIYQFIDYFIKNDA